MVKQVIVARTDLGMRKGKLAAQVAHASLKVLLDRGGTGFTWRVGNAGAEFNEEDSTNNPGDPALLVSLTPDMQAWVDGIFTKIVVGVDSEDELLALARHAADARVPHALVQDVGKTEFRGVPTYTALAVGPANALAVDAITGGLKLL